MSDLNNWDYKYREYCYEEWDGYVICNSCHKYIAYLKQNNVRHVEDEEHEEEQVSEIEKLKQDMEEMKKDVLWIKSRLR